MSVVRYPGRAITDKSSTDRTIRILEGNKMSNKRSRKYFTVTSTHVISANNKSEAIMASQGRRNIDADILASNVDAHQIYAAQAKELAEATS